VTRVFPANGRFTPRQREFYTVYLRLYQALMTPIRVHVTPREIMDSAVVKMTGSWRRTRSQIPDRAAAESFGALPAQRNAAHARRRPGHSVDGSA
jgi:hypothetical protein